MLIDIRIVALLRGFVKHFLCVVFIVKYSPNTTAIHTHLTQPSEEIAVQAINQIAAGLILRFLKLWMDYKEFQQL